MNKATAVKKKTGKYVLERYTENPFVDTTSIKTQKTKVTFAKVKGASVGNLKTGEVYGSGVYTSVERTVSSEEFVKIYGAMASIWFDLSTAGNKMFSAIYEILLAQKESSTAIYIHPTDEIVRKYIKSNHNFFKGINDLIDNKVIARHFSESWYWTNPYIICKGDQLKVLMNIKKQKGQKN